MITHYKLAVTILLNVGKTNHSIVVYQDKIEPEFLAFSSCCSWTPINNPSTRRESANARLLNTMTQWKILRNTQTLICTFNHWCSQPKIWVGAKCLTLGEQQYFCLGRCFSKHKITRYAKYLGPPWLRLCIQQHFRRLKAVYCSKTNAIHSAKCAASFICDFFLLSSLFSANKFQAFPRRRFVTIGLGDSTEIQILKLRNHMNNVLPEIKQRKH